MMPEQLDLSLPHHVPEIEKYGNFNYDIAQYALYSLLDISHAELQDLCVSIEADYIEDQGEAEPHLITVPPIYNFSGKRLRDIFEHHVRFMNTHLEGEREDPSWFALAFAVINERDWRSNGVLLVNLDCVPDSFQMPTNEAQHILTSLRDIDDTWEHLKDSYQLRPPYPPPWGFNIAIYAVSGIDETILLSKMETDINVHQGSHTICKFQAHFASLQQDSFIDKCVRNHTEACITSPHLLKNYLICADSEDYARKGVLIVNLVDQTSQAVQGSSTSLRSGDQPSWRSQRAATPNAIFLVRDIAAGSRLWTYSHNVFGVCSTGFSNIIKLSDLLDPQWMNKRDEERAFEDFANFASSDWAWPWRASGADPWSDVLNAFTRFCKTRTQRFAPDRLHRGFFVCCDNDQPETRGVLLVKVNQDHDGATEESEVEVQRCPTGEALQALADVADGRRAWNGRP